MVDNIRFKAVYFLFNLGMKILPKQYRSAYFINNLMRNDFIKLRHKGGTDGI